jgi:hypothetical protein
MKAAPDVTLTLPVMARPGKSRRYNVAADAAPFDELYASDQLGI